MEKKRDQQRKAMTDEKKRVTETEKRETSKKTKRAGWVKEWGREKGREKKETDRPYTLLNISS